jgi:hypothetical protein
MLPLLFPLLADTVIAPYPHDYGQVRVHEWGVVTFTSAGTEITGAPGGLYGHDPFGLLLVDAPVVWFHGEPFGGTFTVRAEMGFITTAYPKPSEGFSGPTPVTASWRIVGRMPQPFTEVPRPSVPENTPFRWAMDFWRDVPCLDLYTQEEVYLDRFLYYETAIPDGLHARMNTVVENGRQLAGFFSPDGIRIVTGPEPLIRPDRIVPLPLVGSRSTAIRTTMHRQEILDRLCDWAGGNLKSHEIAALWNTWEPFFTERPPGEIWLLFPLPPETVEGISSIHLQPDDPHLSVEYHRLFLGLVRLE